MTVFGTRDKREMFQIIELIIRDNITIDGAKLIQDDLDRVNWQDRQSVKSLCDVYNNFIAVIKDKCNRTWASPETLKCIMKLARDSIDLPNLKSKEPIKHTVYGELGFDLIEQISRQMTNDKDSVFVDLGAGIGNVVFHIAGALQMKKCVGIEILEDIQIASMNFGHEFRRWMKFFNKNHSEFACFHGDFQTPHWANTIKEATHIIANNIEFGPSINNYLEEIFMECRSGTEIYLSSMLHRPTKSSNRSNRKSIINVAHFDQLKSLCGNVSWKSEPIQIYRYVIDHLKFQNILTEYLDVSG